MSRTYRSHKPLTLDQRRPDKQARRRALPKTPSPFFSVYRTLEFEQDSKLRRLNELRWNLRNYGAVSYPEKLELVSREIGKSLVIAASHLEIPRFPVDAMIALRTQPQRLVGTIDDAYLIGDQDSPLEPKRIVLSLDGDTNDVLNSDKDIARIAMGLGSDVNMGFPSHEIEIAATYDPDKADQMFDAALNAGLVGQTVFVGHPIMSNTQARRVA